MPDASDLGHVHLRVRDLERAVEFYADLLGLSVSERHRGYAFLTFGDHHHDLALQEVGPEASGPSGDVGLYHAAFEVDTPGALAATYEHLRERNVQVTPVDHGISKALYFDDPDGNGVEVYWDAREESRREEWEGRNRRFDPRELRD